MSDDGRQFAREGRDSWWSLGADVVLMRRAVRKTEEGRRGEVTIGLIAEMWEREWDKLVALG